MVCILDADKEGFLRSETSLIQTIGRSAGTSTPRSSSTPTRSPRRCSGPSTRRSDVARSNWSTTAEHGITPESIVKAIRRGIEEEIQARTIARKAAGRDETTDATEEYLAALEAEMLEAAEKLEFERAAALRDKIMELRSASGDGPRRPAPSPQADGARGRARARGKARAGRRK